MIKSSKYSDFIKNLKSGKICVFETDTVVGIGCRYFIDWEANNNVKKIFKIKKRSLDKPLPWLISPVMLKDYVEGIPDYAEAIIKEVWPGDTTLVFKCKKDISNYLNIYNKGMQNSIAFRVPDSDDLISAIDYIGSPVACTSANFSSEEPATKIDNVNPSLLELTDFIYTKNIKNSTSTKPSQIISCLGKEPKILRK